MVAAKKLNQGILISRQLAFSIFDSQIHNPRSQDDLKSIHVGETYNRAIQDATLLKGPDDLKSTNGSVTTSHYIWGVEALYYSYI